MVRNVTWKSETSVPALVVASALLLGICGTVSAETRNVWEKAEITLHAKKSYEDPYSDVEVWVDLKGPGFDKRCYGFWDGRETFRIRVLATAPGTWTWTSGGGGNGTGGVGGAAAEAVCRRGEGGAGVGDDRQPVHAQAAPGVRARVPRRGRNPAGRCGSTLDRARGISVDSRTCARA